jgi:hypothetical protein
VLISRADAQGRGQIESLMEPRSEALDDQQRLQHTANLFLIRNLVLVNPDGHGRITDIFVDFAAVLVEYGTKLSKPGAHRLSEQFLVDLTSHARERANIDHQNGDQALLIQDHGRAVVNGGRSFLYSRLTEDKRCIPAGDGISIVQFDGSRDSLAVDA